MKRIIAERLYRDYRKAGAEVQFIFDRSGGVVELEITSPEGHKIVTSTGLLSITCQTCGITSYNPHDVIHRYCGKCHQFLAETQIQHKTKYE